MSSSHWGSLSGCTVVKHGSKNLERRLDVFGTKCLCRIMGYRWNDFVSNQRLLHETGLRSVISILRERHLRLYWHVAHLLDVDPAHRVFSVRDSLEWIRSRGRPRRSWLGKIDRSCRLGMNRTAAWKFTRGDRLE